MRIGSRGALALLMMLSPIAAACSSSTGGSQAPASEAPASTAPSAAPSAEGSAAAEGLPYTATLKDGSTFTLNQRVADKLAAGEPINYVFSYGSTAIPLFSPQYAAGY